MKFKLINDKTFKENVNYSKSLCYGVFTDENFDLTNLIEKNEYINFIINKELLNSKLYKSIILYYIPKLDIDKLIIINCGKKINFTDYEYKNLIKKYIKIIKKNNFIENTCLLTLLNVKDKDDSWKIKIAVKIIEEEIYSFSEFKKEKKLLIEKINFVINNKNLDELNKILLQSQIISDAVNNSKDLGNLPANICNSKYLEKKCIDLSKSSNNIDYESICENDMKLLKMNAYLSVSMGSKNKPIMSILKYKGADNNSNNIVLIGKGLTFDTGGISLKKSSNMDEMKFDMCGAATVYGVMKAIDKLKLPINVIGILAICENSIDGKSLRPGDIIKTMSGKTVEVLNTDAEGRLVLCDAITYSYKFKPSIIIDIATLTGACVIALGNYFSGLMSNDDDLSKKLIESSNKIDDKIWKLPLTKDNQEQIDSNIADIKNIGDGKGGTITAGYFLYNFIKEKTRWAHLDIAGTSYDQNKKSTGRPIYLLTQFLIDIST